MSDAQIPQQSTVPPVISPPPPVLFPERITPESYGGFWIRVGAFFVDFVVMLIPSLLISFLWRAVAQPKDGIEQAFTEVVDFLLSGMAWWIYTAVLTSLPWQGTIGKKVCGLKVVDYNGQRISFARATGRYFAWNLSALILFIGYMMIGWTIKKQGLHDFMANTLVVRDRK